MQRVMAAVIAVAMLGGCPTYQSSRTTAKAGGYTLLAGVVVAAATVAVLSQRSGRDQSAAIDVLVLSAILLEAGVVLGGAGLVGMLVHDKPAPDDSAETPPARERLPDPAARSRARAMDLTKQAVAASYAGDCAAVKIREAEVLAVDPELHAAVFVEEVTIKRCLDAADSQPVPHSIEVEVEVEPDVVGPSPGP